MPRYLVLHGYHQSSEVIAKKIKGLFNKNATFDIPDGPLIVEDDLRGWFPLSKIDLITGTVTIDENDINTVLQCDIQGSYDAVIAFSQGCLTAALLVGAKKVITSKLLLFSPISYPTEWPYIIEASTISAKVYIGEHDTLVPNQHSLSFISALGNNDVEVITHRWGHIICSTS